MVNIAGAILAGGKSSRMGQDKAELQYEGITLLEHTQKILNEAGLDDIYISRKTEVADIYPNCGPLGGIHAILTEIEDKYSHVIFVPIDMLKLTSTLIKQLIDAPEDTTIIRFADYPLPFRIATNEENLKIITYMLEDKSNISLKLLQKEMEVKTIPVYDNSLFANVNTKIDWQDITNNKAI